MSVRFGFALISSWNARNATSSQSTPIRFQRGREGVEQKATLAVSALKNSPVAQPLKMWIDDPRPKRTYGDGCEIVDVLAVPREAVLIKGGLRTNKRIDQRLLFLNEGPQRFSEYSLR